MRTSDSEHVIIVGAGPAGLTAAFELARHGITSTILEGDPRYVGGLARTIEHQGFRFDIGGHRFFSKNQEIEDLWTAILGHEMLSCGRLSRIRYRNRYIDYPLKPVNAVLKLGALESCRCIASYMRARIQPIPNPQSFEDWVSNQFGRRLFDIFFKTYTEKVWGMSTKDLSVDWAAQRIKSLNLGRALRAALLPGASRDGEVAVTLIDQFRYPRLGPGQMWDAMRDMLKETGSHVVLDRQVVAIRHDSGNGKVTGVVARDSAGAKHEVNGTRFISTMPVRDLIRCCEPPLPLNVREAAERLRYRDFLMIGVTVDCKNLFPDNWIYVHDPRVLVGRIQNFKNWSADMVPDAAVSSLGLEYFCFEGDDLWSRSDADLARLAAEELAVLGICDAAQLRSTVVVRQSKAYPVYDETYRQHVGTIRQYIDLHLRNLHLIGRNGMHRYNNQDHSMMTALLVARNIATGTTHDPWRVNNDAEYHEESRPVTEVLPVGIEETIRK